MDDIEIFDCYCREAFRGLVEAHIAGKLSSQCDRIELAREAVSYASRMIQVRADYVGELRKKGVI